MTLLSNFKRIWEIFTNFVAFSQYLNFTYKLDGQVCLLNLRHTWPFRQHSQAENSTTKVTTIYIAQHCTVHKKQFSWSRKKNLCWDWCPNFATGVCKHQVLKKNMFWIFFNTEGTNESLLRTCKYFPCKCFFQKKNVLQANFCLHWKLTIVNFEK